jgi:hypothetical protein
LGADSLSALGKSANVEEKKKRKNERKKNYRVLLFLGPFRSSKIGGKR